MKKMISCLMLVVMLLCSLSVPTFAEDVIRVAYKGNDIAFDVNPQIINNRTMVPLRAIFETLEAKVDWDPSTQTITSIKEGKTVVMQIGNPIMNVNDAAVTLDSPPIIIENRTLIPVRAIAEAYSKRVNWDGEERVVVLSDKKPFVEGEYVFDEELYTLTNNGLAHVSLNGGTKYSVTVPADFVLQKRNDYANDEIFSTNVLSYSNNMSFLLNVGATTFVKGGPFKSYEEFLADYKRRWPSSTDTYECIYFDYHEDENFEYEIRLSKHTLDENSIKELNEYRDKLESGLDVERNPNEEVGVSYEAYAYCVNKNNRSEAGYVNISTNDSSNIDTIISIISSINPY